jgi:hypothetical protein
MAGAILPGDLRDHVDITGHESILWCGHSLFDRAGAIFPACCVMRDACPSIPHAFSGIPGELLLESPGYIERF